MLPFIIYLLEPVPNVFLVIKPIPDQSISHLLYVSPRCSARVMMTYKLRLIATKIESRLEPLNGYEGIELDYFPSFTQQSVCAKQASSLE